MISHLSRHAALLAALQVGLAAIGVVHWRIQDTYVVATDFREFLTSSDPCILGCRSTLIWKREANSIRAIQPLFTLVPATGISLPCIRCPAILKYTLACEMLLSSCCLDNSVPLRLRSVWHGESITQNGRPHRHPVYFQTFYFDNSAPVKKPSFALQQFNKSRCYSCPWETETSWNIEQCRSISRWVIIIFHPLESAHKPAVSTTSLADVPTNMELIPLY